MIWMGCSFGVFIVFWNFCIIVGVGKKNVFFDIDFKDEDWWMVFVLGVIFGGFIGVYLFMSLEVVVIFVEMIVYFKVDFGISYFQGNGFLLIEVFNYINFKGIIFIIIGGFLVGFGVCYGWGCIFGYVILGLLYLQFFLFIMVIGFFIGGLFMIWVIMLFIF